LDQKEAILLDTDIGGDIDDALCLAYLLAQPRCELLGITTVGGNPIKRAMIADAVCRALGRSDVPIHSGAPAGGMLNSHVAERPEHQEAILERWEHREDFAPAGAIDHMRAVIRSRPNQVTLLAIGPLTNIGLLFALDPELPSLLKRLVLMCGSFYHGGPSKRESNALSDPYAAAIVYNAAAPFHLSVGLDVTYHCGMPLTEGLEFLRGRVPQVVMDAADAWAPRRHYPYIYYHDPLAAAVIFDPAICSYEDGEASVEITSPVAKGATYWMKAGEASSHRIAVSVDVERFFDHFFRVVSGGPVPLDVVRRLTARYEPPIGNLRGKWQ